MLGTGAAEQPVWERMERGRIFWTQGDIGTLSKRWPWIFIPMFHHEAAQLPAAPLYSRFFCFLIILLLALKFDLRIPLLAFWIPLYSMTSSGATDSIRFLKEKNLLGPAPHPRPCHWSPARLQTIWVPSTEPRLAVLSTACGWGTWRLKSRTSQGTGHSLQHSSAEIIWRQEVYSGACPRWACLWSRFDEDKLCGAQWVWLWSSGQRGRAPSSANGEGCKGQLHSHKRSMTWATACMQNQRNDLKKYDAFFGGFFWK